MISAEIGIAFAVLLASLCSGIIEYSISGGYALLVVPLMVLMGFNVKDVISTVLLVQVIGSSILLIYRYMQKRIELKPRSEDIKNGSIMGFLSLLGALIASSIMVSVPTNWSKITLTAVILSLAILLIIKKSRIWRTFNGGTPIVVQNPKALLIKRIVIVPLVAGVIKGLVGSGFSVVLMAGQVLTGVEVKRAVLVTIIAKIIPSLAASTIFIIHGFFNLSLFIFLLAGIIPSIFISSKFHRVLSGKYVYTAIVIYMLLIASILVVNLTWVNIYE